VNKMITDTKNVETASSANIELANSIHSITVPKTQSPDKIITINTNNPDLSNKQIQITIEEDANATILISHQAATTNYSPKQISISVKKNATAKIYETILFGSAESKTEILLQEDSASANHVNIFLGSTQEKIVVETKMLHTANETKGNMLCRAVLMGGAKANFQAEISIPSNLKNIDSHQNMKCLTIGDKAKCDALPILDVSSDSVSCSHGAAIGRIEDEPLTYLQSRGISESKARAMLLKGFLMQELKNLPEETRNKISNQIDLKLCAGDSNE